MKFGKMFMVGAAAFAMVLGTVGCATDSDEGLEMFKVKKSENGNGALDGGKDSGFSSAAANSGDADLDTVNNRKDNDASAGVGSWSANKTLSPYDDFGTPITGLTFQPVYFRFDQSSIDSNEAAKLDQVASYLKSNPGTGVVIEGNCDSKGSEEYNRALGERRALAAKDYLLNKGIADSRIRTVSYGEEKPAVVPDNDEASRAKNRRDEFIGVTLKR